MRTAREARRAGQPADALDAVWTAYAQSADDAGVKRLAASLLREAPSLAGPEHAPMLLGLVRDPAVEPESVGRAGWAAVLARLGPDAAGPALAEALERDVLALALLEETPVAEPDAERRLAQLRRWLLVEHAWPSFPGLAVALARQARLNGGAWWFDGEERALLSEAACAPMTEAYLPRRGAAAPGAADATLSVSSAVARQYERWPYPRWRRITRPRAQTLPDVAAQLDPALRTAIPVAAEVLVAGCGTGRQAAGVAASFPDARVTAIDVSGASLDFARDACAALDLVNITFAQLDLISVADLGRRFHAIYCTGVLHHLEKPEAGWAALAAVLRPGGLLRLGLYSRAARLLVTAARQRLADLAEAPVDDDLIRLARRRLLAAADDAAARQVARSGDFATLEGACDLLLHPHEDAFTVPRIGRAIEATGLRPLRLVLPAALAREYEAMFPDDPGFRDLDHWSAFEKRRPASFASMYDFWCGKPA